MGVPPVLVSRLTDQRFGDMGAYQFWISPEDLRARRWSGVGVTFECS